MMQVIRVQTQVDSDTLHVPELKAMMGKTVEITISELESAARAGRNWQPLIDAAAKDVVDSDLYKRYREFDRQQNISAER
jgi:hypothetical protein